MAYEALLRNTLADSDVCEIAGIGPSRWTWLKAWRPTPFCASSSPKAVSPMAVTPGVRTIPRALRLLLEARDRTCVVPGCDVSRGLQVDHRKPFAQLGPTDLDNCGLLCKLHHDMKTYLGYRLERHADGSWTFTPPDDFRDPEPADPAVGEPIYRSPWTGQSTEFGEGAGFDEERAGRAGRAGQLALVGASGPAP